MTSVSIALQHLRSVDSARLQSQDKKRQPAAPMRRHLLHSGSNLKSGLFCSHINTTSKHYYLCRIKGMHLFPCNSILKCSDAPFPFNFRVGNTMCCVSWESFWKVVFASGQLFNGSSISPFTLHQINDSALPQFFSF